MDVEPTPCNAADQGAHKERWLRDGSAACTERRRCLRCGNWSDASLKRAMDAVTDRGVKLKTASRIFGVPATSLCDHLYGKTISRQRGKAPVLKVDEEKKLVDHIF